MFFATTRLRRIRPLIRAYKDVLAVNQSFFVLAHKGRLMPPLSFSIGYRQWDCDLYLTFFGNIFY